MAKGNISRKMKNISSDSWHKIVDTELEASQENEYIIIAKSASLTPATSTTYILTGRDIDLKKIKIYIKSPADSNVTGDVENGAIQVKGNSGGFPSETNYGAITWKTNSKSIVTLCEISADGECPTYMEYVTNSWNAANTAFTKKITWGNTLKTHSQVSNIRLIMGGSKKFVEGTEIIIWGIDR